MEAALPRLSVQAIPNGPPMPEGWVPPQPATDPVGDMLGQLEDPYGGTPGQPVDPAQGRPYAQAPAPAARPATPAPAKPREPTQRIDPGLTPEKKPDALFF